jgi:hypothetical protein
MQIIPTAAPPRSGIPKDPRRRLNAGGIIERSGGYDGALSVAAESRHGRAARAANRRGKTFGTRQIESFCLIPARDPLQVRRFGDQVCRVTGPRGLPAARAMAVNETHERPSDPVSHRAAQTASMKHLISHDQAPFLIGIGQRYIDRLDPVKKKVQLPGEVSIMPRDSRRLVQLNPAIACCLMPIASFGDPLLAKFLNA